MRLQKGLLDDVRGSGRTAQPRVQVQPRQQPEVFAVSSSKQPRSS